MSRFTDDHSMMVGIMMQLIRSLLMFRLGCANCDRVCASMQRSVNACLVSMQFHWSNMQLHCKTVLLKEMACQTTLALAVQHAAGVVLHIKVG